MEIIGLLVLLAGALVLTNLFDKLSRIQSRLVRQELLLRRLAQQAGAPPDPLDAELAGLVAAGKRVEAIRRVRRDLRLSPTEASEYLDLL